MVTKRVRWTLHAETALADRGIDLADAELILNNPEYRVPDRLPPNEVLMRRFHDRSLGKEILLRVVVEETDLEIVVVTVYKTSRMDRYLRGLKA